MYKVGMEVTVSVKELYDSKLELEQVSIETENNEKGKIGYWDLYNTKYGLVCMDGETCTIIDVNDKNIKLRNEDGEVATEFILTLDEAKICCYLNE